MWPSIELTTRLVRIWDVVAHIGCCAINEMVHEIAGPAGWHIRFTHRRVKSRSWQVFSLHLVFREFAANLRVLNDCGGVIAMCVSRTHFLELPYHLNSVRVGILFALNR